MAGKVLESYYKITLVAQLCGIFPIKGILGGLKFIKFQKFSKSSLPVLYSGILTTIIYLLAVELTFCYWIQRRAFIFNTDALATDLFIVIYIHSSLVQIQSFDDTFNYKNTTKVVGSFGFVFISGSIFNVCCNLWGTSQDSYRSVSKVYEEYIKHSIPSLMSFWIVPSPLTICLLGYISHIVSEFAVCFVLLGISFMTRCIIDRLDYVINVLQTFPNDNNNHLQIVHRNQSFNPRLTRSMSFFLEKSNESNSFSLALKVSGIIDIFYKLNQLANEVIAVFTASTILTNIAASYMFVILSTQYVPLAKPAPLYTITAPLFCVISSTTIAFFNFVHLAETLGKKGNLIHLQVAKLHNRDKGLAHLWCLVSHQKFSFYASGFFNFRRSLITHTMAPFLTFIIVLVQLRSVDIRQQIIQNSAVDIKC